MDSKDEKIRAQHLEDGNQLSLTSSNMDSKDEKTEAEERPGALDESLNDWDAKEEKKVRYVGPPSRNLGVF